jgi:hypothetical protein
LRLLTNANNFVGFSELTSSTGAPSRISEFDFAAASSSTDTPSLVPELDLEAASSSTDTSSRISEFDFAAASVKRSSFDCLLRALPLLLIVDNLTCFFLDAIESILFEDPNFDFEDEKNIVVVYS